jgi:hypothetical protein
LVCDFDFLKSIYGNDVDALHLAILNSNFSSVIADEILGQHHLERFIGELLLIADLKGGGTQGTHFSQIEGQEIQYDVTVSYDYISSTLRNVNNLADWDPLKFNCDLLIKDAFKVYAEFQKTKST